MVDYPLAQAVEDGIVKKPIMGELSGVTEHQSNDASVRYRDRLTAGITKWREAWERFRKSGKKPVLFIMADSTAAADQIYEWLEQQPDFAGRVLNIHTNRSGVIAETKSNQPLIDQLREAARQVDSDDNPYRAIVSVLMLREGWDVRNVVVIVPLRPYTAKAQILPEQTLGRGLRLMNLPASGTDEQVSVIEHEAFKPFWKNELDEEGLDIEWVPIDKVTPNFQAVYVDKSRLEYDVEVPLLTPALVTTSAGLETMGIDDIELIRVSPPQPRLLREGRFGYKGIEMLSLQVVEEHEIERDFPADPVGYVSVMCQLIEKECKLTGQFHLLAGLVKEYIEHVLFDGDYSMEEDYVLVRLNKADAKTAVFKAFVEAIRARIVEPQVVRPTGESLRFGETPGFEWSRTTYAGNKTVFNLVACDNQYEAQFASFLDRAPDVAGYAKNNLYTRFTLDYQNSEGAIRLYYPDFLVRLASGAHWLIETKGVEDVEVQRKDARAGEWCKDVTQMTGVHWGYIKVPYTLFQGSTAQTFEELLAQVVVAAK